MIPPCSLICISLMTGDLSVFLGPFISLGPHNRHTQFRQHPLLLRFLQESPNRVSPYQPSPACTPPSLQVGNSFQTQTIPLMKPSASPITRRIKVSIPSAVPSPLSRVQDVTLAFCRLTTPALLEGHPHSCITYTNSHRSPPLELSSNIPSCQTSAGHHIHIPVTPHAASS